MFFAETAYLPYSVTLSAILRGFETGLKRFLLPNQETVKALKAQSICWHLKWKCFV